MLLTGQNPSVSEGVGLLEGGDFGHVFPVEGVEVPEIGAVERVGSGGVQLQGVDGTSLLPDAEVEMGAGGRAGGPYIADELPLGHARADPYA